MRYPKFPDQSLSSSPLLVASTFLLILLAGAAASSSGNDMETVRLACLSRYCWPSPSSLPGVVSDALELGRSLNATFYWPDVNYDDPQDRANWGTFDHLSRLQTMTQALTTPGSSVFESAPLSALVHGALDVWLGRAAAGNPFACSNWYYNWIGVPSTLETIFLLLGVNRTTGPEAQSLIDFSYNATWWENDYSGGANLADMLRVQIFRGLASNNTTAVTQGFDTMWASVVISSATEGVNGVVLDYSYHFHGEQLLTYAYGVVWANAVMDFHGAAEGTAFDLPASGLELMAAFFVEGCAPLSFGRYYDYLIQGRGIDRPNANMYYVPFDVPSLQSLANASETYGPALLAWTDLLEGNPDAAPLVGAKYFWNSDFLTLHRPTWGAALKMYGNNTFYTVVGGECDNSENVKGEFTAMGVLNVYGNLTPSAVGTEYMSPNGLDSIFPLWDWSGLNGITVEHDTPLEPCDMSTGDVWAAISTEFVGAACDGMYAVVAMDTATHNLTAHRSWLFFDDAIIALGADITDPTSANVRTALASRLLPSGGEGEVALGFQNGTIIPSIPDGQHNFTAGDEIAWVAAGGNSYVPFLVAPSPLAAVGASVSSSPYPFALELGSVTGNWTSIGPFEGVAKGRVLSAWLDHGTFAAAEAYAYAILPAISAADTPTAATSLFGIDRACIVNTPGVQGAAQPANGLVQVVFWQAQGGTYTCQSTLIPGGYNITISSTGPAMVLLREGGAGVSIYAQNPTLLAPNTASVTINRLLENQANACHYDPATLTTTFTIEYPSGGGDYVGKTVNQTCTKQATG